MTARERAKALAVQLIKVVGRNIRGDGPPETIGPLIERALLDTIEEAAQKAKSPCNCGQCETCAWHNDIAAEIRKMGAGK